MKGMNTYFPYFWHISFLDIKTEPFKRLLDLIKDLDKKSEEDNGSKNRGYFG